MTRQINRQISRQAAEALAVEALGFLAADEERLSRFLALSGIDPANIREAAADPGFFPSVLEYLASDEQLLLVFASNAGRDPGDVNKALIQISSHSSDIP
ncbi:MULTISPECIES: DUF3572 domain-containing protein [unclassified Beijerinckia]|uniref:DUF3572 domain-containing protein n=1 Tax=unclassified Beijerinckia TaxID=2638183 RepID=UPI000B826C2C|nr:MULTISPECIES: DUF3572 domain-containing protein [unclassified Beijerinckia]